MKEYFSHPESSQRRDGAREKSKIWRRPPGFSPRNTWYCVATVLSKITPRTRLVSPSLTGTVLLSVSPRLGPGGC